jgi:hypothetical protein
MQIIKEEAEKVKGRVAMPAGASLSADAAAGTVEREETEAGVSAALGEDDSAAADEESEVCHQRKRVVCCMMHAHKYHHYCLAGAGLACSSVVARPNSRQANMTV